MRRLTLQSPNLSWSLVNATHELDWTFGLRHSALLTSPIWSSRPYLVFAYHLLSRAHEFAAHYNAALHAYRSQHRIKTPGRPMPDLQHTERSQEAPFWLDHLATGSRSRLSVSCRNGLCLIASDDDSRLAIDPTLDGWQAANQLSQWLTQHNYRLTPRALTLTLFLRLCICDQFVHGIGGGRYDQVLDTIIASYFQIPPPAFSVTTTTLFFPTALNTPRVCLPCIEHQGHQLRHRLLGEEKLQLVRQIEALPRNSEHRRQLFQQMHARLRDAANSDPRMSRWQAHLTEARQQHAAEEILYDREFFYALQPRARLEQIIAHYTGAFEP